MIPVTPMNKLVGKICQNEIKDFEAKVIACIKEKDQIIQTLQLEAKARSTKLVELRKKLESEIVLFRQLRQDFTKKDKVIEDLELMVQENNLKTEKTICILITMVREERARVRFLTQEKTQEDQEIADIRSNLEARVISINRDCAAIAELNSKVANDENDDALTEEIELNESLEMEKLLEEEDDKGDKDKDGNGLDTFIDCVKEKVEESEDEIIHTADTLSNMIDTLLGKLGDKENYIHRQLEIKTDNVEPDQKKLKIENIEEISLSTGHSNNQLDMSNITNASIDQQSSICNPKISKVIQNKVLHHEVDNPDKISCSECNIIYRTKQGLEVHTQSIHKGIRYDCNKCDYRATQKSNLVTHKKRHHC